MDKKKKPLIMPKVLKSELKMSTDRERRDKYFHLEISSQNKMAERSFTAETNKLGR